MEDRYGGSVANMSQFLRYLVASPQRYRHTFETQETRHNRQVGDEELSCCGGMDIPGTGVRLEPITK
jgi:hypothetical protein